jgi:hypothetical protein
VKSSAIYMPNAYKVIRLQFHVSAAIMVQRSIGVKKRKQDVIAFVNTVTQFIHRGSYAHCEVVSQYPWKLELLHVFYYG